MAKSNKGLIIVLILLVLGLTGYIIYDKVSNKEVPEYDNVTTENENNKEETTLPKWASYLLEQNITKITVKRFPKDGYDPEIGCPEDKQITVDQLKQILEKMTQGKLTKYLDAGGFGGPCLKNIIIIYNNGEELDLFLNEYIITKDKNVKSLLELEDYVEDNTRNSGGDELNTLFRYEWDNSFVETLFA